MLEAGLTATVSMHVRDADLASAFAETEVEHYPHVLSTPALLGLMERACAKAMVSALSKGQLSVGVNTDMSHTQPTALDVLVTATATLSKVEGALYWFDVEAADPAGIVARARHARSIVDHVQIEQRAERRRIA